MAGLSWLLNLEGDLELAGRAQLSGPVRARLAALREQVAGSLLRGDDRLILEGERDHDGRLGVAFLPTRRAQRLIGASRATVGAAPEQEVLARVNARGFALEIGPGLPGSRRLHECSDPGAALGEGAAAVRVVREYTVAGRGHRVISGPPTQADLAWMRAGLAQGPLTILPQLEVELELVVHGWLSRAGEALLGPVCAQEVEGGAWLRTRSLHAGELEPGMRDELLELVRLTCCRLAAAGYFGPFGVDALVHRGSGGALALHAPADINARFTTGWRVGLPDLDIEAAVQA